MDIFKLNECELGQLLENYEDFERIGLALSYDFVYNNKLRMKTISRFKDKEIIVNFDFP